MRQLREVFRTEDGEDFADLLRTVTAQGEDIRAELAAMREEFRAGLRADSGALHARMNALDNTLSAKISDVKSDLMKWSFVFWVGAVLAVAALAGVLGR